MVTTLNDSLNEYGGDDEILYAYHETGRSKRNSTKWDFPYDFT